VEASLFRRIGDAEQLNAQALAEGKVGG